MSTISAAMLLWSIGTSDPAGPSRTVEVIAPAVFQGRAIWRVTHYALDPTAADADGFDLYDLDRDTLAPIRSVMRTNQLALDLTFEDGSVVRRQVSGSDQSEEQIPLAVAVKPEGPGLNAYLGSLPLAIGYRCEFHIVDRWAGSGAGRVKPMTLAVTGESQLMLGTRSEEVFDVVIQPSDESYMIRSQVRKQPPHYGLAMEYVRGRRTTVSEVTELALS